jgi:hypothetical protein
MNPNTQPEWALLGPSGLWGMIYLLTLGVAALIVDYGRMLYLRRKMVTFLCIDLMAARTRG